MELLEKIELREGAQKFSSEQFEGVARMALTYSCQSEQYLELVDSLKSIVREDLVKDGFSEGGCSFTLPSLMRMLGADADNPFSSEETEERKKVAAELL